MPRVDFYVLDGTETRARLATACRLIEKAFLLVQRISVLTDSEADARVLDDLLWTFRDRSFVPHELQPATGEPDTPVVIAWGGSKPAHRDLLVNLGTGVPADFGDYTRIAEFVDADDERKRAGRERYRYYLGQGIKPDSHHLGQDNGGTPRGDQEAP